MADTGIPLAPEERPALQALLRGAKECAASLPTWSTRLSSVTDLARDLAALLAEPHKAA